MLMPGCVNANLYYGSRTIIPSVYSKNQEQSLNHTHTPADHTNEDSMCEIEICSA